jgi:hypothetical protein
MYMKKFISSILFACFLFLGVGFVNSAQAKVSVKGYTRRSTGTYVTPHYRTSPNSTKIDNWSTKGNSNPYTGKKGYAPLFKLHK